MVGGPRTDGSHMVGLLEQGRVYTTLSPRDGGVATRSTMTDNGDGSISAAWEVDDQIWVRYRNTSDNLVTTTATVTAVNPSTKAATITVTLTDPVNGGEINFGYPISYYERSKDLRTDQLGTLADINANYAAIFCVRNMTVSGSDVTLPAITMHPETCIWKFSFKDGSNDITSAITNLVINLSNSEDSETYIVTPSLQSTIYVSLLKTRFPSTVSITAQTATGVYRKTAAASVTLEDGYTYTTTGFALKKAEVGKVFGLDGNIYDDAAAATAAGTSAVAKITYVGNDAETNTTYNHGLALALTDANDGNIATWCSQKTETCLDTQYDDETDAKTDMAGIANTDYLINYAPAGHTHSAASVARNYNSGTHPTGTSAWFLPSVGQWDKMVTAAGDYAALATNANLQSDYYWSSTEFNKVSAWDYDFGDGILFYADKDSEDHVRSVLSF